MQEKFTHKGGRPKGLSSKAKEKAKECQKLNAEGMSNVAIARELNITRQTVAKYLKEEF